MGVRGGINTFPAHTGAGIERKREKMSKRCNIIVKDQYDELFFYRHSDGYPAGALPTLREFMALVGEKIRDNVGQSAGWLIVIGNHEYRKYAGEYPDIMDWKVGAYEPTTGLHGDIEYVYILDLQKKEIRVHIPIHTDRATKVGKLLGTVTEFDKPHELESE